MRATCFFLAPNSFVRSRPKTGESGRTRSKFGQNITFLANLVMYSFSHVYGGAITTVPASRLSAALLDFENQVKVCLTAGLIKLTFGLTGSFKFWDGLGR